MLILENDNLTIDVRHNIGESVPTLLGGTKAFPFYLDITIQVNGKLKRISMMFDVYEQEKQTAYPPIYGKMDVGTVHTVIHLLQGLGYDIDYAVICSKIESHIDDVLPDTDTVLSDIDIVFSGTN